MYKVFSARSCDVDKVDIVWVLGESDVYNNVWTGPRRFHARCDLGYGAMTFREGRCCFRADDGNDQLGRAGGRCLLVVSDCKQPLCVGFLRNPSERLFGLESEFELEDARGKYDEIHSFSLGLYIA